MLTTTLQDMNRRFEGLDQITEAAFLDLGAQVQKFHLQARNITTGVSDALALLDGENCGQAVTKLQLLVERCSLWMSEAQKQTGTISQVLSELEFRLGQLMVPLNGLRKVSKTLQALRVTTRIEASKTSGRGAEVMSQELGELIGMVQDKTVQIDDQIEKLGALCRQALSQGQGQQVDLLRQAQRELQTARHNLSLSVDQRLKTSSQTEKLKQRSEEITFSFGEIIAALQFQDITRQRLEHIQQALSDLSPDAGQGPDLDARLAGRVKNVCDLQSEQLVRAINEFNDASQSLIANLETMAGASVSLVDDVRNADFDTSLLDQSEKVAPVLQSITDWLENIWAIHQSGGTAVEQVCLAVRSMTELIEEIEFIGEEIQLLAMNAAINAAHSSGRGGGLEVIADNIQGISEDASKLAMVLANECLEIAGQADSIDDSEQEAMTGDNSLEVLIEESRALLKNMQHGHADIDSLFHKVKSQSVQFADDVAYMVKNVDIQERFMNQVSPLLAEMQALARQSGDVATDETAGEAMFEDLSSRYTMMSERKVHEDFISRQAAVNDEAIAEEKDTEDETVGTVEHDLGENVELF